MNKYILTISAIFLGLMVLPIQSALAAGLTVEFSCGNSTCPIFGVVNFAPGGTATGWAKVTNGSDVTKKVVIKAINETDSGNLSSKINLVIKEGDEIRYSDTFTNFFADEEIFLSSLASGIQTQYDLTATFNFEAGDDFQGKSLGFDISIGFQGEEGTGGGVTLAAIGGGGGGGTIPFSISEESIRATVDELTVTINWTTTDFSTSQVIYSAEGQSHTLDLNDNTGVPPKYGYANTTPETDIVLKATYHTVVITGLDPSTTYYFRTVSRGSFAVSGEHTFGTSFVEVVQQPAGEEETGGEETTGGETAFLEENAGNPGAEGGAPINPEGGALNQLAAVSGTNSFLASLASIVQKIFGSKIITVILILIFIILIVIIILKVYKKIRKRKEN